jgi:hypothetical protein
MASPMLLPLVISMALPSAHNGDWFSWNFCHCDKRYPVKIHQKMRLIIKKEGAIKIESIRNSDFITSYQVDRLMLACFFIPRFLMQVINRTLLKANVYNVSSLKKINKLNEKIKICGHF